MGIFDRKEARLKRKQRIRKRVFGEGERPRLSVFRSAKHVYAQIIDDRRGMTIVAASSLEQAIRGRDVDTSEKGKMPVSLLVGKLIAERAMEKGIKKVVFDRNGFLYHGRIKAVSEGARKAGLDF